MKIEIVIDDHGRATIHVQGIPGQDCVLKTSELVAALGNVEEIQITEEFYTATTGTTQQTVQL